MKQIIVWLAILGLGESMPYFIITNPKARCVTVTAPHTTKLRIDYEAPGKYNLGMCYLSFFFSVSYLLPELVTCGARFQRFGLVRNKRTKRMGHNQRQTAEIPIIQQC